MQQKDRNIYWDIIKGVAIILMVLGHSIEYGGGQVFRDSGMAHSNVVFQLIYSFHMPLFMLVSGYFFYKTEQHYSAMEIFSRKLKQLLVPICSFSIINFVLKFECGWDIVEYFKVLLTTFLNTLWFLWVLLIIYYIQLLLNLCKVDKLLPNLFIFLCLHLLPDIWFLPELTYLYPFFVIGYYLCKTGFVHNEAKNLGWKSIANALLFAALFLLYNKDILVYESGTCLIASTDFDKQLWIDTYRILIGISGCVTVLYLVKWFIGIMGASNDVIVLLSKIGALSMGIFCFQDSVLCVYHHFTRSIAEPSFLWWTMAFVIIFTACILATVISKRVKLLNTILLGGR